MGPLQTLDELIGFLDRRKWMILLVAAIGTILSAWLIETSDPEYEAIAAIEVQAPEIADFSPGGGNRESLASDLLLSIERRLMTRENLVALIDRHGLYAEWPDMTISERVRDLKGSIELRSITDGQARFGQPSVISEIIISARYPDPELAARLANDLTQSILDQGNQGAADRVQNTFVFYQREESDLRQRVITKENEIASIKNSNPEAQPEVASLRREELAELSTELRVLDQSILERQAALDQLDDQGQIRETDRRREGELTAAISLLTQQRDALLARQTELNAILNEVPDFEQTLSTLQREMAMLQGQYDVAVRDLADAERAVYLAENQQGERFALLERAVSPPRSQGLGRRAILLAAIGVSTLAGLALAFFLEVSRPVIRTSTQMERMAGVMPMIALPELSGIDGRIAATGRLPTRTELFLGQAVRSAALLAGVIVLVVIAFYIRN